MRENGRGLFGLTCAGLTVGAAAVVLPPFLQGVHSTPFIQIVAMHRLVALVALVIGVQAGMLLWARARGRMRVLASVAIAGSLIIFIPWTVGAATASTTVANGEMHGSGLSVFLWNTNQVGVDTFTLERAMTKSDADIIVLPEHFQMVAKHGLADWTEAHRYELYSTESTTSSVLIKKSLGKHSVSTKGVPPWAGFLVKPSRSSSPTIAVVHVEQTQPFDDSVWKLHMDWIAAACRNPNIVAVGDFNTPPEGLTDGRIGACRDVATAVKAGGAGSWPTNLPPALGAQIDRVRVGKNWDPANFAVVGGYDDAGSDHRPVAAVVRGYEEDPVPILLIPQFLKMPRLTRTCQYPESGDRASP